MIGLEIDGLEKLAKNCDIVAREISRANLNATMNVIAELIGESKAMAPHKTGELRRSIMIQSIAISGTDVTIEYGSELPYARIHELGGEAGRNLSVHITGKHYLRNPVRLSKKIVEKHYKNAWNKIEARLKT